MLARQLLNALVLGCIYALYALNLTPVFGVLEMLNLAHASFCMSAAMRAVWLVAGLTLPVAQAILLTTLAGRPAP